MHVQSPGHVQHDVGYFRANRQSLNWHGILVFHSPGVVAVNLDVWNSINWPRMQDIYASMHQSLRRFNPDFFAPVEDAEDRVAREEKEAKEEKGDPPVYAPPANGELDLLPVAPIEPIYSSESEDDAFLPVAPEEPIYSSESEDGAVLPDHEPPSYQ